MAYDTTLQDLTPRVETILAQVAGRLDALGIDVPCRQYVAPGQIAVWDEEQLVVNLQSIGQGQPGQPHEQPYTLAAAINLQATFTISLVRRIPALHGEGTIAAMTPTALNLDAAGRILVTDAGALIQVLSEMMRDYVVSGQGEGFAIGELLPQGPEGGYAASMVPLMVSIS